MNDAKWKRGLRVPSASITLVATSAFATKGGQVRASHRYHVSSVVQPSSRHRYRQRGQTEISHPCLLNKAWHLAALHTHDTTGISGLECLFSPALSRGQRDGRFLRSRPLGWRAASRRAPCFRTSGPAGIAVACADTENGSL